jgi:hypothetical protein
VSKVFIDGRQAAPCFFGNNEPGRALEQAPAGSLRQSEKIADRANSLETQSRTVAARKISRFRTVVVRVRF